MKQRNREELQRAIGIIEGVSYSIVGGGQDALSFALEMLDAILRDEPAEAETAKAVEYAHVIKRI